MKGLRGYVVVGAMLVLAACGTAYGTAPDEVPIGAPDAAAMKKGTFKAWLSDATKGPSTTFVKSPRKYLSTSGVTIANNWTDLTDGSLQSPLSLNELGVATPTDRTWTATGTTGAPLAFGIHCTNWTTEGNSGDTGRIGSVDSLWTDDNKAPCGTTRRLYCFEQ